MKITVLGCNGPYPAANGATSGYLLEADGVAVLLDCGSGVFAKLCSRLEPKKLSAVILSHMHFDHMSDLGVLNYYCQVMLKKGEMQEKLRCYAPVSEEEAAELANRYDSILFYPIAEGAYTIAGLSFCFYSMRHPVPCLGLTVNGFGYTGDTNLCAGLEALLSNCRVALMDGGFLKEDYSEKFPHLHAGLANALAQRYRVQAYITHLSPAYTKEELEKECHGAVVVEPELEIIL